MSPDIRPADFDHPSVQALLDLHFRGMHASSPPGTAFVLDLSGLRHPDITAWAIWSDGEAMGVGALRQLTADHGEIKSMRTRPDMTGQGLGSAMLAHIVSRARDRGMTRLSLETGAGPAFEPALRLYRRRGFVDGAPFAGYQPSDFNQFLHLDL